MAEFQKGQKIPISIGGEATVIQRLGEGGQGFVYKVSYNGTNQKPSRTLKSSTLTLSLT